MKTQSAWAAGLRSVESAYATWHQIQLYVGEDALRKEIFTTRENLPIHLSDLDRSCQNIIFVANRLSNISSFLTETEADLFLLQAETFSDHLQRLHEEFQNAFGSVASLPIESIALSQFIRRTEIQRKLDLISHEAYLLWPTLIRFWQYGDVFHSSSFASHHSTSKDTFFHKMKEVGEKIVQTIQEKWGEISELIELLPLEDLLSVYGKNILHVNQHLNKAKKQIYISLLLLVVAIIGVSFIPTQPVPVLHYFDSIGGVFGVIMSVFWRLLILLPFILWWFLKFYEYKTLLKIRQNHTPRDVFKDAVVSSLVTAFRLFKEKPNSLKKDLLKAFLPTILLYLRGTHKINK